MKSLARRLFRLKERFLLRYRNMVIRTYLGHLGKKVKFFGNPILDYPENISMGDGCTINHGVVLGGRGGLTIGRNVRISSYAIIETGFLIPGSAPRRHGGKPIVIEDNVWIASRAIVLAGVRIGRDSIIAAGSVITKDVPPNMVAKGMPARYAPLGGGSGEGPG